MKTLKAIAFSTAAVMAMVPSTSSAQVTDILNLVSAINADVANKANLAAINLSTVDGGVDITVTGSNGGTSNGVTDVRTITTNLITTATNESTVDVQSGGGAWASAGDGSSSTIDADAIALLAGSVGTGSGEFDYDWSQSANDIDNSINDQSTDVDSLIDATASTLATSFDIGDVTTAALGAVNSGDIDFTETAGSLITGSMADTTSTSASADYAALIGSGTAGISLAANFATIDGAVTATITGGSGSLGNVSTTAAGAINSGSIIANVVGVIVD